MRKVSKIEPISPSLPTRKKADIAAIYAGGNQNYAVTKDGKVLTWGLKGFLCGTDDLGLSLIHI